MSFLYDAMRVLFQLVVNTFFRDIQVIGLENIPINEPVILCGNHSNQFVDGMMLVSLVPRRVSFIMAAKSVKRPVIGHMAKAIGVIPVERAQDLAKPGKGNIISIMDTILKAEGTNFKSDFKIGDSIFITTIKKELLIKEIMNDSEMKIFSIEDGFENQPILNSAYKIIPKVDQSEMFDAVFKALNKGQCIGIFPEGGSHDRSDFLELKAGVSIMALGAMSKFGTKVKIVPMGLNYYKPHAFRSKVIIDIGKPYEIPNELCELYKVNKREATGILLTEIGSRMKDCRITAPTFSELNAIFLIRNLYKPDKLKLTAEKEMNLNRKFAVALQKMREHPEIAGLLTNIKDYYHELKTLEITDSEIVMAAKAYFWDILSMIWSFAMMCLRGFFALPGLILSGPFALLLQYLGENERRKALAGSKVKIAANDVVASYKIVCAFIIFPLQSISFTVAFYLIVHYFSILEKDEFIWLYAFIFYLIWPLYTFMCIRSLDGFVRHGRALKAKLKGLIRGSKYVALKNKRETFQRKIRDLVDKHGPEVFSDFDRMRVISKIEIKLNRRHSQVLDDVFMILEEKGI